MYYSALILFVFMANETCSKQERLRWGVGGVAAPSAFIHRGAGGARIALHTKLFSSLRSAEEAFSDLVDSLVQENFSGSKFQTPKLSLCF